MIRKLHQIKPTHKVIDLVYHNQNDEIDEEAFVGTYKQCHDFILEQNDIVNLYEIIPLA